MHQCDDRIQHQHLDIHLQLSSIRGMEGVICSLKCHDGKRHVLPTFQRAQAGFLRELGVDALSY